MRSFSRTLSSPAPLLHGRRLDQFSADWFAVQVWTGREHFCAAHLRARAYDVFLPCYQEQRRWSDRVKKTERALFAGYVFCRIPPAATDKIITTPGVIRIVSDQSGPLPVPAEEIDAIQRILATRRPTEPWQFLQAGERVRLETGPLRGTEGVVLTIRNRHRLVVSVSLLQRSVAVEIDPEWVTKSHPIGEPQIQARAQAT